MRGRKTMSKYLNKALFYDERKNIIFSFILYGLMYFVALYQLLDFTGSRKNDILTASNSLASDMDIYSVFHDQKSILLFSIICICLATLGMSYTNKDKKYYFLLTQPIKRDSLILSKTAVFLISYSVPLIIYALLCILIVKINPSVFGYNSGSSIKLILENTLTIFTLLTSVTTFYQLMQVLFGKNSIALTFPPILCFIFSINMLFLRAFTSEKISFIKELFEILSELLITGEEDILIGDKTYKSLPTLAGSYISTNDTLTSLILIILCTLIICLCVYLNKRVAAEKTSELFLFAPVKVIFKIILSLFIINIITFILSIIFYLIYLNVTGTAITTDLMNKYGIDGKENIEQTLYLIYDICLIPLWILSYKILGKTMNKKGVA